MSNKEELIMANADLMTIVAHAKKIGWDSVSVNTLQRLVYLMKVLYSFCHNTENLNHTTLA